MDLVINGAGSISERVKIPPLIFPTLGNRISSEAPESLARVTDCGKSHTVHT